MKQLIKDVLNDMSTGQITLSSNSARELIATMVSAALKSNGTYFKDSEVDKQMAREREKWVCSICGENTFDVDFDYIGSDTNHLGCEMKGGSGSKGWLGMEWPNDDERKYREKNWSQKEHEDKIFGHDQSGSFEIKNPNDDADYYTGPDGH